MATGSIKNEELLEEIEAVNAIYEPDTVTVSSSTSKDDGNTATKIILKLPNHNDVTFLLGFNEDYPASPPKVLGTASTGSRGQGKKSVQVLVDAVQKVWQPGFVCLYDTIVEAEEYFEQEDDAVEAAQSSLEADAEELDDIEEGLQSMTLKGQSKQKTEYTLDKPPEWSFSYVIAEKKSVFLARAAHVTSRETAEAYIDYLIDTDKKVAQATHNITAWRIRQKTVAADGTEKENLFQDFDDDGESAAGGRVLHLMQLMDVWNVVVIVTRWYGGIKLGPDRFRLINEAAREALVNGGWSKQRQDDGHEKGKKKGKK